MARPEKSGLAFFASRRADGQKVCGGVFGPALDARDRIVAERQLSPTDVLKFIKEPAECRLHIVRRGANEGAGKCIIPQNDNFVICLKHLATGKRMLK